MIFNNMETDTLVIGAGQAGIATSEHLTKAGIVHIVVEKGRIAEKWRSARWDSLVANGPAWHDRFPNLRFEKFGDDDFVPKEDIADYFVKYTEKFDMPIYTGVTVQSVQKNASRSGFVIDTDNGVILANYVVVATGAFQNPNIPPIAPQDNTIYQIHSSAYRNPSQLPEGNVLVVGAGSSGVQIADELQQSGRQVYLSVGTHDRPPRSYRGRDFVWWLGVLGLWDLEATSHMEHVTIAVTGAHGAHGTVDFRKLAHNGMHLVGVTKAFKNGVVSFNNNLADNIRQGDKNLFELLDMADAYVARNGLDLPEQPELRKVLSDPECMTNPTLELNVQQANVTSIIWATGFKSDYSWLKVDAFNEQGYPAHQRGVSSEPGVYFVGLPWQSRRGSSFIWGVWHDAKHITDHITTRLTYMAYHHKASHKA